MCKIVLISSLQIIIQLLINSGPIITSLDLLIRVKNDRILLVHRSSTIPIIIFIIVIVIIFLEYTEIILNSLRKVIESV